MKKSLTLLTLSITHAAVLATYSFDNTSGTTDLSAVIDASSPSYTVSDFSAGVGFTLADTPPTAFTSEALGLQDGTASNLAGAITNNEYFTFTVTNGSTSALNLTSISFDAGRTTNGARDFYLFSSLTGFTSTDVLDSVTGVTAATDSTLSYDLAPLTFSDIDTVEFRIYVDNRSNNNNNSSGTYVDNVVLNGTFSVPEPSSTVLLGLGSVALLSMRRR